jgi:hypothetical protein
MILMKLSKAAFAEVFKPGAVLNLGLMITGLDILVISNGHCTFPLSVERVSFIQLA